MKKFSSVSSFFTVKLTGADIPLLLERLTKHGIILFHIQWENDLNVQALVRRTDFQKLKAIVENQGAMAEIIHRTGIYWLWRSIIRRPIMVAGITFLLLLSWFVPTRVFFISVEGNENVPAKLILEKAAQCGITFGASRREVRSENMKNNLLASLPELQWTGINTYGCTAVISVAEKAKSEEERNSRGVSSIVAQRDGIIHSCTVTSGNPLCVPGQAVKEGETLVSGYTDCGIKITATRSKGEIYAQTTRQLTVKTPMDYTKKGEPYQTKRKYSLILGNKRINFFNYSGNSTPSCDKIYSQFYCVLPGGFQLPISIVIEQWSYYKTDIVTTSSEPPEICAQEFSWEYLTNQMICGKILGKVENKSIEDTVYTLTGRYICLEMIGREQSEEIIKHYGQSD